jgi:hypothetical protein
MCSSGVAQENSSKQNPEVEKLEESASDKKFVGLGIGMAFPKTDLAPKYQKPGTNFSAVFQFNKNKRFNLSFWLNIGQIQSEDRTVAFLDQSEFQINSFASTNYQSVHVEPSFHLLKKENWGVFVAQGFGFLRFEVYDQDNNNLANLPNSRAPGETATSLSVILPTSLGGYYFLENGFGIHFKMSLMNTLTDYLDNISTFGNPDNNDNVANIQLSVLKRF